MAPHLDALPLSNQSYARLRDEALIEAEALRHQAIDEFWRGSRTALLTAATRTLRTANRTAARLGRRCYQHFKTLEY